MKFFGKMMTLRSYRLSLICSLFVLLTSCSDEITSVGIIEYARDSGWFGAITIDLPEAAEQGEAIQLTFNTWNACSTPARTDVQINGMEAIVTPYDTTRSGTRARPCPLGIVALEHTATLKFEQSGTATITVRGRSEVQGGTIDVVRTVTVQ